MASVQIIGIGGYLPERILTNKDLESLVATTDEWIAERTGIRQRHIAATHQRTSDLATEAARVALADAGLTVHDLDAIVVATTSPDMIFPSTASIVQYKLGGSGFPAWDVQAVCSGFIYGLAQMHGMMQAGMFKRVLLIGAETMTRLLNWQDRSTCVLFGDGAGAVVLESNDGELGLIGSVLHCDGQYRQLLMAEHTLPGNHPFETLPHIREEERLVMQGSEVFRNAVAKLGEVVGEVLGKYNLTDADLDWLVPHQANMRIISATARKLGLPLSRVALTVERHANTSAASVPLALWEYHQQGRLQTGQLLLLEAFGGGFVWGANLLRWSK